MAPGTSFVLTCRPVHTTALIELPSEAYSAIRGVCAAFAGAPRGSHQPQPTPNPRRGASARRPTRPS